MLKNSILSLVLLLSFQLSYGQKKAEKAIRSAYESYKAAILENEGEQAIRHVDSQTIDYYANLVDWAMYADSAFLETLPLMDKLATLLVRGRTPKEELRSLDGPGLLIRGIDEGMVGKGNVVHHDMGAIDIRRKSATAQFVNKGKATPMTYQFNKEKRKWKINLISALKGSEEAFAQMIAKSGKSENEFLMDVVEDAIGPEALQTIWQPIE